MLSFAYVYFLGSSIFNELWSIQIKFFAASPAGENFWLCFGFL